MNKIKFKGKTLYRKRCINNILAVYNDADRHEQQWYRVAHEFAQAIKGEYSAAQACGVIAALSPLKSWDDNMRIARLFMLGERHGLHTQLCIRKAQAILDGENIETTLGGNKITAFYNNILRPDGAQHVTIDRHAQSIALGRKIQGDQYKMTGRQYGFFESVYKDAARLVGLLPLELQAITWVQWRKYEIR